MKLATLNDGTRDGKLVHRALDGDAGHAERLGEFLLSGQAIVQGQRSVHDFRAQQIIDLLIKWNVRGLINVGGCKSHVCAIWHNRVPYSLRPSFIAPVAFGKARKMPPNAEGVCDRLSVC